MPSALSAVAKELDDVIGGSGLHDNLRNESVRARIGSKPHEIDRSMQDVLFTQESNEIGPQVSGCPVDQGSGDSIALG